MRTILALAAATLMAGGASPLSSDDGAAIVARAVPLDRDDPARVRVGGLTYMGGWVLTSAHRRFGGLSSLTVDEGGLLGLSDKGGVFRLIAQHGRPPAGHGVGVLPDGPMAGRDSESAVRGPDGTLWVGFEGVNAIWRYDTALSRTTGHVAPPAMADWPRNGGPEAMVRLPDGRFLIFSEDGDGGSLGCHAALIFRGDPVEGGAAERFCYRPPAGYVITDAVLLPDGRLLALNRRYTLLDGVSAVLSIIDRHAIRAGAKVESREIARLTPPLTVDNMEALAVTQENGRTILWIASDDNFSRAQRTLLLRFRLD
ncbi:esterase-like activity of phytase family protein [Sphingomonas sp. KC8]|uniref:esterase-like activity of phytase family protein n=1 Tax=Sphingomonas sp. KC8 TaxID=1030157 RepID=UPI0002FE1870|nr:esterase-like activity of phytase family protein [Sphingomonas sp. KC8]